MHICRRPQLSLPVLGVGHSVLCEVEVLRNLLCERGEAFVCNVAICWLIGVSWPIDGSQTSLDWLRRLLLVLGFLLRRSFFWLRDLWRCAIKDARRDSLSHPALASVVDDGRGDRVHTGDIGVADEGGCLQILGCRYAGGLVPSSMLEEVDAVLRLREKDVVEQIGARVDALHGVERCDIASCDDLHTAGRRRLELGRQASSKAVPHETLVVGRLGQLPHRRAFLVPVPCDGHRIPPCGAGQQVAELGARAVRYDLLGLYKPRRCRRAIRYGDRGEDIRRCMQAAVHELLRPAGELRRDCREKCEQRVVGLCDLCVCLGCCPWRWIETVVIGFVDIESLLASGDVQAVALEGCGVEVKEVASHAEVMRGRVVYRDLERLVCGWRKR